MKIKQGFVMRDVAGQAIAIATGDASKSFKGMIKLNATGAGVWRGIEAGLSEKDIAQNIAAAYPTSLEQAQTDTHAFICQMRDAGLLEE
jgi:hypothetical protein